MNENDVFESEFCKVSYSAADNAVIIGWKKFCRIDDYRKPTMFAAELMIKHSVRGLIIDARNGFEDDKADIEWGFSTLLPKMGESPCKKCAFIMRESADLDGEIDLWTAEFMKYFTVVRVKSYEDAARFVAE